MQLAHDVADIAVMGPVAIWRILCSLACTQKGSSVSVDSEFQRCICRIAVRSVAERLITGFSAGAPLILFTFFQLHFYWQYAIFFSFLIHDDPSSTDAIQGKLAFISRYDNYIPAKIVCPFYIYMNLNAFQIPPPPYHSFDFCLFSRARIFRRPKICNSRQNIIIYSSTEKRLIRF